MSQDFPKRLHPFRAVIEATERTAVLFRMQPGPTKPRQSKLGGAPYFPADANPDVPEKYFPDMSWTPWPKHPETGCELQLLIQINFAQMPRMDPYPTSGILQLFVDDGKWHDLGQHLRAVYHADVSAEPYDFGDVPTDHFRVPECALDFMLDREYMTCSDFRFERVIGAAQVDGKSYEQRNRESSFALGRDYLKITDHRPRHNGLDFGRGRNKIGGYHYSQNAMDPRTRLEHWRDSLLLAQFQDYGRLSWGDGGSAQFFIRTQDLKNLDFSDLLFHWDST